MSQNSKQSVGYILANIKSCIQIMCIFIKVLFISILYLHQCFKNLQTIGVHIWVIFILIDLFFNWKYSYWCFWFSVSLLRGNYKHIFAIDKQYFSSKILCFHFWSNVICSTLCDISNYSLYWIYTRDDIINEQANAKDWK